jgi:hypothetical protein
MKAATLKSLAGLDAEGRLIDPVHVARVAAAIQALIASGAAA